MDQAKYEALVEESVVAFKKAINPFEKAYEVSKNSQLKTATAECLKSIYYRFSSDSDEYMQNYKKYDEILKAM